jgi:hypothetical protein
MGYPSAMNTASAKSMHVVSPFEKAAAIKANLRFRDYHASTASTASVHITHAACHQSQQRDGQAQIVFLFHGHNLRCPSRFLYRGYPLLMQVCRPPKSNK